jgi:bis(5'-nucleosyl)-tetraphosphatase (symmetrical)
MATWAIGDVHGAFAALQRLVRRIRFDPRRDRLWFVGDLVNRGPQSLAVLRWVADLEDRATVVLGNHDVHLLARAAGLAKAKRRDTLDEVLEAPDRDGLLAWLRARPLLHREGPFVLVHAGLLPQWTVDDAADLAAEAERELRGDRAGRLLAPAGEPPDRWRDDLSGAERRLLTFTALTRLRTVTVQGRPCLDFSGSPAEAPKGCLPWFALPGRRSAGATVLFGHWAALGLYLEEGVAALDSGAAWGRCLTAYRLDDGLVVQVAVG